MEKIKKIRRKIAKILVIMLILSIVGNAGIVQAETMAEGEEAVDIQVEPGAPVPVEAFDTDITEIETIEKTDGEEKVSEGQKAAEGRSYEKKLFRDNGWDGSEPRPGTELRDGDTVSFSDQLALLSGGVIIITILCRISGKKQEENP